ncbi:hypothetical protein CHK_2646 [Christensenella hongkongensis]|uniref:Uncharacterized protein n=1 Tax=Christensenella hongkongensis TaxID=270498 RepID=A0A0M2NC73_9FIRM|nr:hypothetical protein CHK_2646 [Christensenella hongkongensis]
MVTLPLAVAAVPCADGSDGAAHDTQPTAGNNASKISKSLFMRDIKLPPFRFPGHMSLFLPRSISILKQLYYKRNKAPMKP